LFPPTTSRVGGTPFSFADLRLTPHYPAKPPLDDVLALVLPGTDEYASEKYALEIGRILSSWAGSLKGGPPASEVLVRFLDVAIEGPSLTGAQEKKVRADYGLEIVRRTFRAEVTASRERFLAELTNYFSGWSKVETAEFEIVGIEETTNSPLTVKA